jgi:nitroreductase
VDEPISVALPAKGRHVSDQLGLTPEELLTTTRTVRKRLDLDRPVERSLVEACLRLAFQAPNGSNRQTWQWICIDDPATKAAAADIYRAALNDMVNRPRSDSERPPDTPEQRRMAASVAYLSDNLHRVPVLVVPTFAGRVEDETVFWQASRWGSICPAIWSFMLALRLHGLGSAWTTLHLWREREMGELLGIAPTETQAGLFPVAFTLGTQFRPADRELSTQRIRWNA